MFDNEVTWLFIGGAIVLSVLFWSAGKTHIEEEHTKQLELQLKIAQTSLTSTNHIER